MKKSILSVPLYIVCLYLLSTLISCNKENPITPPPVPSILDSNYLDWSFDTIDIKIEYGIFVADTDNIFIPGRPYLININGGLVNYINYNDNDFGSHCITGTNINNVFIGGISLSLSKSKLKKWNGSTIEDIALPMDTSSLFNLLAVSENDVWMTTTKNIIYHYSNHLITTFRLDSNFSGGIIFKDNVGNIYSSFYVIKTGDYEYLNIYKFVNDTWVQVSKDSANRNLGIGYFIGFSGDKYLRNNASSIDYFNGTNWEKYINLNGIIRPYISGGGSPENILFQADENYQAYVFYYDGTKFYRTPNRIFPDLTFGDMQYKFGRYYLSIEQDWFGKSYLGTGKIRSNNFNNSKLIK